MATFKRYTKEEDSSGNPFQHIEKTTVLQEVRSFNVGLLDARKCGITMTKLLYLLNQGEQLGTKEATDAFFAVTKLFQYRELILRRMVYLGIKELSGIADDVIIVTSSLMKDMTGKEDLFKAPAIRALCSITDASMLHSIERYMKQAIVDKNTAVSSAALVSSLHMLKIAPDVVKRWANEAQEAINSDNVMVQYHALGLLYHIRKNDRLAVTKLVSKLTRSPLKSPYAMCLLIRIAAKLIDEDDMVTTTSSSDSTPFDFIESCLRHKSEMVVYEAAHAIVNLKRTTARELTPAISVLQLFCGSPKATVRFAAVRALNQVSISHPAAVTTCNLDLEHLISDSNRSIATLAITTLLKTGAESSVDRLMKQIAGFVSEISDEFKIVVVQAIKSLAYKFPRKHPVLMSFLSAMLRDEGGLDYKASIADTIITIVEDNADAKETGLAHLCEFIEDCEHTSLAVRILHLVGKEGPRTKQPNRYIRFIYNRVILENPTVRAAAVAAMAQFGATCSDLLENIKVLLKRCQMDSDDEVRDRATYYSWILNQADKGLFTHYILEPLQVSIPALERLLGEYISGETDKNTKRFDLRSVPLAAMPTSQSSATHQHDLVAANPILSVGDVLASSVSSKKPTATIYREETFTEQLKLHPQISELGPLFKSSEWVALTESETEYYVRCVKHCFDKHLVFQFDCINTLSDQLLEHVRVQLDPPTDTFSIRHVIECERLPYNEVGSTYVILQFPFDSIDVGSCMGTFGATLKFLVKDCDPHTNIPDSPDDTDGYDDEYILEDIEILLSDQIQKLHKGNSWQVAWEDAENNGWHELEDTYCLSSMNSLEDAVKNITEFLGLQPAERSDKVPEGKSMHTLLLAGVFRGGIEILVRAKLAMADEVTMQLTVRCTDENIADLIIASVG